MNIEGDYNNFQQYWKENTDDEIHRDTSGNVHKHLHVTIRAISTGEQLYEVTYAEGRLNPKTILQQEWQLKDVIIIIDQQAKAIKFTEDGFKTDDGEIEFSNAQLHLSPALLQLDGTNSPYSLRTCRYFSGWIQYPPDVNIPDELFSLRDLIIHDQGGLAEIEIDEQIYTVELTQLVFAHTIFIMKLAIYKESTAELGINSKAISYTWTNPEATRIGINLRHIISGWTLIEPGFINSNNLKT